MDKLKLLIADGTEEFPMALADHLRGAYTLRTCCTGLEALEMVGKFRPDILILDLMLPGLDGLSLLQQASAQGYRPMVLATTRYVSNYVLEAAERFGVGYVMVKPCDIKATAARIADLSQRLRPPVPLRSDSKAAVSNLLLSLGVPTKLRGYGYLREAVIEMMRDPTQMVTKELYPSVADRCSATDKQVERSIRTAITAAWSNRDEPLWRLYFQPGPSGTVPKPTNAAFISRLAQGLRLEATGSEE